MTDNLLRAPKVPTDAQVKRACDVWEDEVKRWRRWQYRNWDGHPIWYVERLGLLTDPPGGMKEIEPAQIFSFQQEANANAFIREQVATAILKDFMNEPHVVGRNDWRDGDFLGWFLVWNSAEPDEGPFTTKEEADRRAKEYRDNA